MISDTNLESHWKAQRYTNVCNADDNQIWFIFRNCPILVQRKCLYLDWWD